MADQVRFALAGCGRLGVTADEKVKTWLDARLWYPYSHAEAIWQCPRATLVAVADVKAEAAQEAAKRYGLKTHYTDFKAMIDQEKPDAISIATRTAEREDIIRYAVQKGVKGIYCEKPLSNSLEAADTLLAEIEKHKVVFVYGTKRRYMPIYEKVRQQVDAGAIGELTTIVVRMGYGKLFWSHPHSVDIASYFAHDDEVAFVQGDLDLAPGVITEKIVDADPLIRMGYIQFRSGLRAHIIASEGLDVELCGRTGLAVVRSDGHACHWRTRLPEEMGDGQLLSERVEAAGDEPTGTVRSIQAITDAILYGKDPGYDIGQAVRNQEILFGFVQSHLQGGKQIHFPIERDGMTITGRTGQWLA